MGAWWARRLVPSPGMGESRRSKAYAPVHGERSEEREAERRQARLPTSRSFRLRLRADRSALASRRSTAIFAAALTPQLSPRTAFPKTWLARGFYPRPPVPVQRAPRGPVVVPVERDPRASRERGHDARPQAIALAPLQGSSREAPFPEQGDAVCNYFGDKCQYYCDGNFANACRACYDGAWGSS